MANLIQEIEWAACLNRPLSSPQSHLPKRSGLGLGLQVVVEFHPVLAVLFEVLIFLVIAKL